MAKKVVGQSAINRNSSSPGGGSGTDLTQDQKTFLQGIFVGRVLSVIEDESHPRYAEQGYWSGVNAIEIEQVSPPADNVDQQYLIAYPFYSNVKQVPLVNELVLVMRLPSKVAQAKATSGQLYYFPPLNVWNHNHVNPLPKPSIQTKTQNPLSLKSADLIEAGSPRDESYDIQTNDITLGKTFIEKDNIRPLLPFEGDVIIEGRWGNSIRFSSTVPNSFVRNSWSLTGNLGDPITIIRNGQFDEPLMASNPIIEDIERDQSSIYLTSKQSLPLNNINSDYTAYISNEPIAPSLYNQRQIAINSGRLLFNAMDDHILLSGQKSIGLNSNGSIILKSNDPIVLSSTKIYLGGKEAKESILLGDTTVAYLEQLIESLITLVSPLVNLKTFVESDMVVAKDNSEVQIASKNTLDILNLIKQNTSKFKSKIVRTL